MVVFGNSDFASDHFLHMSGNNELITNVVNYPAGLEDFITIPKKQKAVDVLLLTRKQGLLVFFTSVVVVPLIVLLTGILLWHRRRPR
jgi:ABC-type uncharacterized transport system involved in gliding motility auxiliary subunit